MKKEQLEVYDNLAEYTDFLSRLTKDDEELDMIYDKMKQENRLKQIQNLKGLQLLKKSNDIAEEFNNANFLYAYVESEKGQKIFTQNLKE